MQIHALTDNRSVKFCNGMKKLIFLTDVSIDLGWNGGEILTAVLVGEKKASQQARVLIIRQLQAQVCHQNCVSLKIVKVISNLAFNHYHPTS